METVCCNLCGSNDLELVYRIPDVLYHPDEWFSVVSCRRCGLGFVNPRPGFTEMSRYYPSNFYDYFTDEESMHLRRYAIEAGYLPADAQGKTLLDVGCANGDFPRFMMRERGWCVEGVEVSPNSRPIEDFPVYRCDFSAIPVGTSRYDAITAWAVLEHVHNPMSYFRKAGEVLKPGGNFVFLVTNFDSISSRHLFGEDVPRHLYFFTESTVRRYLEANGLRLISATYDDRIYSMRPANWLRHYFYRRFKGRAMQFDELPETRAAYIERKGLQPGMLANLRYMLTHPLTMVDRTLMPLYERWQMRSGNYGIVTYVAQKD